MGARFWTLLAAALCLGACADLWGFGDVTVGTDGGVMPDATAGTSSGSASGAGSGSSITGAMMTGSGAAAAGTSGAPTSGSVAGTGAMSGSGATGSSGASGSMSSGTASGAASGSSGGTGSTSGISSGSASGGASGMMAGQGIGDPCSAGSCQVGLTCDSSWCTEPCTSSAACGTNEFGKSNVCAPTESGSLCFPGCSGNADCSAFPHTVCFLRGACAPPQGIGDVCMTGNECLPNLSCASVVANLGAPPASQTAWCGPQHCSASSQCEGAYAGGLNVQGQFELLRCLERHDQHMRPGLLIGCRLPEFQRNELRHSAVRLGGRRHLRSPMHG